MSRQCYSAVTYLFVCLFDCQPPPAVAVSQLPLPGHTTVNVWAAVFTSDQQQQNMFFLLSLKKLGRQRLHTQTASYYLSQPEDVIIFEGEARELKRWQGFLPTAAN